VSELARMSPADRLALFTLVAGAPSGANRGGVSADLVEKDAWVCFILERLFRVPGLSPSAANASALFKGGTSLSKAYGLIERFSEDVDVTLDPALFGRSLVGLDKASRAARSRRLDEINVDCAAFVRREIQSALEHDVRTLLRVSNSIVAETGDEPGTLRFLYPAVTVRSNSYVLPYVKLEFGARSDREPWEFRSVRSWAAEALPESGLDSAFDVPVLRAERTFWEKATILHAENARARRDTPPPLAWGRLSRHAYDLATMAPSSVAARALDDVALLRRVCDCKQARFAAGHVDYDVVGPTTIEIVPRGALLEHLAADYDRMADMIFGPRPTWREVVSRLEALEVRVRRMRADS
jgi:hypothetical protein